MAQLGSKWLRRCLWRRRRECKERLRRKRCHAGYSWYFYCCKSLNRGIPSHIEACLQSQGIPLPPQRKKFASKYQYSKDKKRKDLKHTETFPKTAKKWLYKTPETLLPRTTQCQRLVTGTRASNCEKVSWGVVNLAVMRPKTFTKKTRKKKMQTTLQQRHFTPLDADLREVTTEQHENEYAFKCKKPQQRKNN